MRCSYPGHTMAKNCPPGRYLVEAPPDRLGRTKTFQICENALYFALRRDYTFLEAEP